MARFTDQFGRTWQGSHGNIPNEFSENVKKGDEIIYAPWSDTYPSFIVTVTEVSKTQIKVQKKEKIIPFGRTSGEAWGERGKRYTDKIYPATERNRQELQADNYRRELEQEENKTRREIKALLEHLYPSGGQFLSLDDLIEFRGMLEAVKTNREQRAAHRKALQEHEA